MISPRGTPDLVAKWPGFDRSLHSRGLRTWIWPPLVLGVGYLPKSKARKVGPKIWAQKWGPKFGGLGLGKNQAMNLSPFGFPTFMGMNRQDPEENPPGHVAKVELRGRGAILSVLAFPALYPIHPRRANREHRYSPTKGQ